MEDERKLATQARYRTSAGCSRVGSAFPNAYSSVRLLVAPTLAEQGMPIEEGTLYPLLRRLEEQGLLASDWRIEDGTPPRRYYKLNSKGTGSLRI